MKKLYGVTLGTIIFDQLIKNILLLLMSFGESKKVIADFFNITLIGNTGAAFSILSSNTLLLIVISVIALNFIYFFLIKGKKLNNLEQITYGLLIGGIIGNLVDRVAHGQVIDYLDFSIFGYNFPIFNLADIAIVVAMILLVVQIIKGDKNEISSKTK